MDFSFWHVAKWHESAYASRSRLLVGLFSHPVHPNETFKFRTFRRAILIHLPSYRNKSNYTGLPHQMKQKQ